MSSHTFPNRESGGRICDRVRTVRTLRYGERGRSAFARDLGIPVASLFHYETDRTPPAELLVAIAQTTGVRLEWLLTGTGQRECAPIDSPFAPLAERLLSILTRQPELESYARDFLDLLELHLPHPPPAEPPSKPLPRDQGLIPLVGSTAAGTAHFWVELESTCGGPQADLQLERKIADYVAVSTRRSAVTTFCDLTESIERTVSLVQFSHPTDEGFLEFLAAPQLKQRYPKAVAWRIDGDSMAPRYLDRDLVITSPDHPALEQHPCVARQKGQIGVSCKIFRTQADDVLLIPINERYRVQRLPRNQLQWAWRVLASIRLP